MQPLLDIDEVSELLNTPKQTIYGWRYKNIIPFIKLGRRALFSIEDIQDFIEKNTVPAKS